MASTKRGLSFATAQTPLSSRRLLVSESARDPSRQRSLPTPTGKLDRSRPAVRAAALESGPMALAVLKLLAASETAAQEGKKVIIAMLIVGLVFVGVIVLGETTHHLRQRRHR